VESGWLLNLRRIHREYTKNAKSLACDDAYTTFSAVHPNDSDIFSLEKRAAKAPKEYLAADLAVTSDLDKKFRRS
jgi:hypothetical protein